MRLDRLLAMTILLLNREKMTSTELAEHFSVSVRTIYRDIDALNLAGIPIIAFPGNQGGFGIMENFKLDRQIFTFQDMLSVLSVLKGVNHAFHDNKISSAIEKIRNLVPRSQTEKFQVLSEQMVFDILPWGVADLQKQKIKVIEHALSQNRLLRFTYHNTQGVSQVRTVEPMTLVFKGHAWYLFAFCRAKDDFRFFRITRIQKPFIQSKTFVRREKTYRDFEQTMPAPKLVEVVLRFSPKARFRVEDFFDVSIVTHRKDGMIDVKMLLPDDEWLYSFLLGFGESLEVISPKTIRQELLLKVHNILKKYS